MPAEIDHDSELEIAHVLFIDIVSYSKLPIDPSNVAGAGINMAQLSSLR
jgi:hypothetical protein